MKLARVLACLAITVTALALPGLANAQRVERLQITEYGIYTADTSNARRDAAGVVQNSVTNIRHATTTTMVPAENGVRFGFRYRVIGTPAGQAVTLKKIVIFPVGGLKSPHSSTPLLTNERTIAPMIGETSYTGYSLTDPWEFVPGTWTIQLWEGNRKLAEQRFTVVAR